MPTGFLLSSGCLGRGSRSRPLSMVPAVLQPSAAIASWCFRIWEFAAVSLFFFYSTFIILNGLHSSHFGVSFKLFVITGVF